MKLLYDLMRSLLISPYLNTFIMCAVIYYVGRYNFAKDTATVVSKLGNVMRYFWCQNKISRHLQEINHKFNPRSTQGDDIDIVEGSYILVSPIWNQIKYKQALKLC